MEKTWYTLPSLSLHFAPSMSFLGEPEGFSQAKRLLHTVINATGAHKVEGGIKSNICQINESTNECWTCHASHSSRSIERITN
jgi:hypothetical protein